MSKPSTVLAVDAGTVRIGLAISDETGTFAFPLEVIPAKNAIARIKALCEERTVTQVIVGLPLTMKGDIGPEAARVEKFIRKLQRALQPLPVTAVDERLSSLVADRILESGKGHPKRDAVAAAVILESYLKTINDK
ncbi:MAG: Holliday junction resolvase RuvX [Candidatus Hydrogenedentota bacterium]